MTHTTEITVEDIVAARDRIQGVVRSTPLLRKDSLASIANAPVYLKCEHLQRTGSFKLRGAANLVAQLSPEERARGVVAASAGNHAQGVAVAAAEQSVHATIFMPADASLAKIEATKDYGADVVLEGANLSETLEAAYRWAEKNDAIFVHPFDDERIIAGQGTIGLEILEELPEVATIVIGLGGGGLAAGVAIAVKAIRPECRIIGVQAEACQSFAASKTAGEPRSIDSRPTMADGIAVKQPGALPFHFLDDLLDEYVSVNEEEIATGMLWSMERAKQVLEGAGATPLAALLAGKIRSDGPIVLIGGGGNVDPAALISVIRYGLTSVGRFRYIGTLLPDRPGELSRLLAILAQLRVNILGVNHHREGVNTKVGETRVDLVLQTRNHDHIVEVEAALRAAGYLVLGETR